MPIFKNYQQMVTGNAEGIKNNNVTLNLDS